VYVYSSILPISKLFSKRRKKADPKLAAAAYQYFGSKMWLDKKVKLNERI